MIQLHFSVGFQRFLSQREYSFEAKALGELYQWVWHNVPSLQPLLFYDENTIKPFVCIMRNHTQIDAANTALPLAADDTIEILLPMSGG